MGGTNGGAGSRTVDVPEHSIISFVPFVSSLMVRVRMESTLLAVTSGRSPWAVKNVIVKVCAFGVAVGGNKVVSTRREVTWCTEDGMARKA